MICLYCCAFYNIHGLQNEYASISKQDTQQPLLTIFKKKNISFKHISSYFKKVTHTISQKKKPTIINSRAYRRICIIPIIYTLQPIPQHITNKHQKRRNVLLKNTRQKIPPQHILPASPNSRALWPLFTLPARVSRMPRQSSKRLIGYSG